MTRANPVMHGGYRMKLRSLKLETVARELQDRFQCLRVRFEHPYLIAMQPLTDGPTLVLSDIDPSCFLVMSHRRGRVLQAPAVAHLQYLTDYPATERLIGHFRVTETLKARLRIRHFRKDIHRLRDRWRPRTLKTMVLYRLSTQDLRVLRTEYDYLLEGVFDTRRRSSACAERLI